MFKHLLSYTPHVSHKYSIFFISTIYAICIINILLYMTALIWQLQYLEEFHTARTEPLHIRSLHSFQPANTTCNIKYN